MMNCFDALNSRVFTAAFAGYRKPGARFFCDRSPWRANTRKWLFSLALLLLGWSTVQEAKAANYTFQGNDVPVGCSGGNGAYTCGALTLLTGEVITISSPVTITVVGAFTAGAFSVINFPGTASNLTFLVDETTDILNDTRVNANVTGKGVVTLGDRVTFTGNIVTVDAVINVGHYSTLVGNLTTGSGAINVGDQSKVDGSITTTVAGVVTTGAKSTVTGKITTKSGAVNIGALGVVGGSIASTLAGVVTIGAQATVSGDISTVSGAINLGAESYVSGSVFNSIAGAITLGAKATVGGGVGTESGAITVGDNSKVIGSLETKNAGAVTVGDKSKVGGTVNAKGAKTIAPTAIIIGGAASSLKCPGDAPPPPRTLKSREWRQIFMR